jgi:hypothetical protein
MSKQYDLEDRTQLCSAESVLVIELGDGVWGVTEM